MKEKKNKPSLLFHMLNPRILAPHHADGNSWQTEQSEAPNDDFLYVSPTSPAHCSHYVPIAFVNRHPKEYEDFTGIGGEAPDQNHAAGRDVAQRKHKLGETCFLVWSPDEATLAAMCGMGNYNSKWNRPAGVDKEAWSHVEGMQAGRFRWNGDKWDAKNIRRGERVISFPSNRVHGLVGRRTPQFDPHVDNVERADRATCQYPLVATARHFFQGTGSRTDGALGLAVLDLSENCVQIMDHFEKNWDQLRRTATPFTDSQRSDMWDLTERSDDTRVVPLKDLIERTAVELGVPVDDIHRHVEIKALDTLSRYGPPENFPALRDEANYQHDPLHYARPIAQAMLAVQHLLGTSPPDPPTPPAPPAPPAPDAPPASPALPAPPASDAPNAPPAPPTPPAPDAPSAPDTPPAPVSPPPPPRPNIPTGGGGHHILGQAAGEGRGQGPIVHPSPPSDRSASLSTAPARFKSGAEWARYCEPPEIFGTDKDG